MKLTVREALEDGQISDSEFQKVQTDVEDYKMQKRQIQTKTLDEEALNAQKIKDHFLEEGRKLEIGETFAKLTESVKVNTKRSLVQ